jgi:hypothetical protein
MIDWTQNLTEPAITIGGMAIAGATAWVVRATRTSSDVKAVDKSLGEVKADHTKRLDGHEEDIKRISAEYVPRHELDDKLQRCLDPINRQLEHQRNLLEFAVMGKRPEMPRLES